MNRTSAARSEAGVSVVTAETEAKPQTGFWGRQAPVLVAVVSAVSLLYVLQSTSERLLVSWHGFLHSAIANRFPTGTLLPENPFFAGEPLPYYWFHQMLAAVVGSILHLDPIRAFQVLILVSLAGLIVAGAAIGRSCFQSTGIGLLVAYLSVAGANPLGPAIAGAKLIGHGQPMLNGAPPAAVVDAVFVTNAMADQYLVHPVLPALYYSTDWRRGQNIVWFFDISSRAPAIALTLVALLWLLRPRRRFSAVLLIVTGALLAAINPVMGLSTVGALTAAAMLAAAATRMRAGLWQLDTITVMWRSLALTAGTLLAAPTYYHLFTSGQGGWEITTLSTGLTKWIAMALTFVPIAGLAIWGAFKAPARIQTGMVVTTLAGLFLLGGAFAIDLDTLRHLERGNEHNLTNAALCLLAVPAVAWIPSFPARPRRLLTPALLVVLLFLPTTLLTIGAYLGSPPLPIAFNGRTLVRQPAGGPLDAFYGWARQSTPKQAVFLVDPDEPVKMSGNVSELPAFIARTLFVDHPGYMTDAHPDAQYRRALSRTAVSGGALNQAQRAYLLALNRPLYLVTYHADTPDLLGGLGQQHGSPVFHRGFVAVFAIGLLGPGEQAPRAPGLE
jgi:hypothetical protein